VEKSVPQDATPVSLFDPVARAMMEWKIHWLCRLALFCEFVGHGAFGVLTKQGWLAYFAIFGIPDAWAWKLMPVVGSVDIALGTLTLVAPRRACLLYMAWWGLFTALLRPFAGEGWWEFFERAYNFGIPLFMLGIHGCGTDYKSWFAVITEVPRYTMARAHKYQWALRCIMASMLIGHGGCALVMGKQSLVNMYEAAGFGVFGLPLPTLSAVIGGFEMILGALCLRVNVVSFFIFVCVWKLGTEFLFVPAHAYGAWWEIMERGGSYAAPLLWIGLQGSVANMELERHKVS
jgi:hypothetical protein